MPTAQACSQVDAVPAGMTVLRVPAARYATFVHRGPVINLDMTVNYIYSSWLLRAGMQHTFRRPQTR